MAAIVRCSRVPLFGGRNILRPLASSSSSFQVQKQQKNCKYITSVAKKIQIFRSTWGRLSSMSVAGLKYKQSHMELSF